MATSFGLGPIRDDDELLDRLAAREGAGDSGLEGVLAAWTRAIDEDEKAAATSVGPLGLRLSQQGREQTPRAVRVVKVRRARAVAVLGALTLTLYGGGVAAALTDINIKPVQTMVERVSQMQVASTPVPTDTAARRAWEVTAAQAKEAVRSGQLDRARGMLDVMRKHSQTDAGLAGDVAEVEQQINAAATPDSGSAAGTAAPTGDMTMQAQGVTATAPPEASATVPNATTPASSLSSAATSPSGVPGVTAPAGTAVVPHASVPGSTAPGTTAGTRPQSPTVDSATSSTPSSPSPSSSISSASGNQSVGNGPSASLGEPDPTTPVATKPAAAKPTASTPTAAKPAAIKPIVSKSAEKKSSATKPAASKRAENKSLASKPKAKELVATKPATSKTSRPSEKAKESNEASS